MTRRFVILAAAAALLAGAGQAQAQNYYGPPIPGVSFFGGDHRQNRYGSPIPGMSFFGGDRRLSPGVVSPIPRTSVYYPSNYAPGTIVIDTAERRLYLVQPGGTALRYGIGVGRDGFRWSGVHRISAKREWPDWTPPADMRSRRPDLPDHMDGGIENPLGARALYLGSTLYRIHGSNEPETIGQAVSSGCFRMTNEDVVDLYDRVSVGATVVVKN